MAIGADAPRLVLMTPAYTVGLPCLSQRGKLREVASRPAFGSSLSIRYSAVILPLPPCSIFRNRSSDVLILASVPAGNGTTDERSLPLLSSTSSSRRSPVEPFEPRPTVKRIY